MAKRFALVAWLVLLLPVVLGSTAPLNQVPARSLLELDGVQAGATMGVQGGGAYAEVITEAAGPEPYGRKHLGPPQYEEFEMRVDLGMARPVYDWIAAAWRQDAQRKDGAVVAADFNGAVMSRREFTDAMITETVIPAMDASSRDPGYLTVKFAPEQVRTVQGSKEKVAAPSAKSKSTRSWVVSNFRLAIDGLDARRVSKIDAITVKQPTVLSGVGEARETRKEPGKVEFPNLKITLPAADAQSWIAWHEDFVIKGNNGQEKERNGKLELLAADGKQVLATVRLYNVGIVSIREATSEAGAANVLRYSVEMYVERMEFEGPR